MKLMLFLMVYTTITFLVYILLRYFAPADDKEDDMMFSLFWFLSIPVLIIIGVLELFIYVGDLVMEEIDTLCEKEEKKK